MTFQGQVLLPSQEALIQRLHHVASYSDQLLVLVGAQGSGKTTLLTALATDVDDSNTALVICPMHADNAEIRRKILVQLMSSPIFDDEIPLAETILRVAPNQSKPLHIIIDDAHLLSKELWAECIILNQVLCAGQRIALTLSVPPAFLADLLPQLPESLRRQILPMSVEPLSLPEREALYQTLLRYSDQNPFTPRDIVRAQLEKQNGTPQEVVTLLELALHGQSERKSVWVHYKVAVLGLCSLLITFLIWFGLVQPFSSEPTAEVLTYPALDSDEFLAHGQQILTPYFQQRAESLAQALLAQAAIQADPLVAFHGEAPQAEEMIEEQPLTESEMKAESEDALAQVALTQEPIVNRPQAQSTSTAERAAKSKDLKTQVKPMQGFTIQLASVAQLKSLRSTLAQIEGVQDISIAKYKRRWVILVGHYESSKLAHEAAAQLAKQYRIDSPWVRKWSELKGYELQDALPSGEISE